KLRQLIRELLQPRKLDRELLQVATVEPDEDPLLVSLARSEHLASERQILRIECLEQHEHLEHCRAIEKRRNATLVEHARNHEHAARSGGARFHDLIGID